MTCKIYGCLLALSLAFLPYEAEATTVIPSGTTMLAGDYVESNNGNYSFGIDPVSHNLFFHYKFPVQAWGGSPNAKLFGTSSEGAISAGAKGDRLVMQTDGTLDFYSGNTQVWTTAYMGTAVPGSYAVIEDYGDIAIYPPGGSAYPILTWPFVSITPNEGRVTSVPGYPFGLLFTQQTFEIDNNVTYYYWNKSFPANGAAMQADGNFVVYNNQQIAWSTGTTGYSGAFVTITPVGFVLARPSSDILANIPYPVNVSDTNKARHQGSDPYEPNKSPDPSPHLPIGPGWQCYGTENGMEVCFSPG